MSSYGGPGSNWAYDLFEDGTFEVTCSAAIGWAVELSNGTALLSPTGTISDQMIPMVQGGTCFDGDIGGNWITVRARPDSNATSLSGNYFGAFDYSNSNVTSTLSSGYALTDGFPAQESVSLGQGYCRDGVISTQHSDVYVAASCSFLFKRNLLGRSHNRHNQRHYGRTAVYLGLVRHRERAIIGLRNRANQCWWRCRQR